MDIRTARQSKCDKRMQMNTEDFKFCFHDMYNQMFVIPIWEYKKTIST